MKTTMLSRPFDGTTKPETVTEYAQGYKEGVKDGIFAAHAKDADIIEEWRKEWEAAGKLTPWMDTAMRALRSEILTYRR